MLEFLASTWYWFGLASLACLLGALAVPFMMARRAHSAIGSVMKSIDSPGTELDISEEAVAKVLVGGVRKGISKWALTVGLGLLVWCFAIPGAIGLVVAILDYVKSS